MNKKDNTTWVSVANDNPKDFLEVEIGDLEQTKFYPQVKIKRWDNECNYSIRLLDNEQGKSILSEIGNKINWKKGNIEVDFYEIENAFKFDYTIKEKPATNKLTFSIQSKDVKFLYQPELTEKEKEEGVKRPENVVGSYAVYAETPKTNWTDGKEYKCGKIGHIYRPKLIDSKGKETWADLHIENGRYEVTIPEEFYNNAIYPIRSNDTFGYIGEGGTGSNITVNYLLGCLFAGKNGTGNSMSMYCQHFLSTEGDFKMGLYKESDQSLVGSTAEVHTPSSADWVTTDFIDSPEVEAVNYYLSGFIGNAYVLHYFDADGSQYSDGSGTYPTFPNPSDYSFTASRCVSIYVTYTSPNSPLPAFKK